MIVPVLLIAVANLEFCKRLKIRMKPITIDNLELKDHIRWAQDQAVLDPHYLTEAQGIAHHPALLGMSTIYASQWEALFEWQKRNPHWASFSPPATYHLASRTLFSFRLLPNIFWEEEDEEAKEKSENNPWKRLMNSSRLPHQSRSVFEKDKMTLLNLLDLIKSLNEMIAYISARKLQYQKG
jgi:hypothetical protein